MGQKVVEFIHEWPGVEEHLAGLSFDMTASNKGSHNGAITIIQKLINQRVLFLPNITFLKSGQMQCLMHFLYQKDQILNFLVE